MGFLTRLQMRHIRFIGWPGARMECRHRLQGVRAQWRPHRTSPLRAVQPHLLDDGLSLQPHESVAAQHQRVLSWPLSGEKKPTGPNGIPLRMMAVAASPTTAGASKSNSYCPLET